MLPSLRLAAGLGKLALARLSLILRQAGDGKKKHCHCSESLNFSCIRPGQSQKGNHGRNEAAAVFTICYLLSKAHVLVKPSISCGLES